jgi:hypothetical protein
MSIFQQVHPFDPKYADALGHLSLWLSSGAAITATDPDKPTLQVTHDGFLTLTNLTIKGARIDSPAQAPIKAI